MRGEKTLLQQLVADLGDNQQLVTVGKAVDGELANLANEMAGYIRAEIKSYGEVDDRDFLRAGWQHGYAHAEKISALLQRKPVGDLKFVLDHAAERAEQRFPLNDILHTYRIGHRVMWNFMRDVAMDIASEPEEGLRNAMVLADFTIRYTNIISVALTQGYTQCERLLVGTRERQTHRLFDELSQGRVESAEARLLADSLGLSEKPYLVVTLARTPATTNNADKHQDQIRILERNITKFGIDLLVDDRHESLRALLVPKTMSSGLSRRVNAAAAEIVSALSVRLGLSIEASQESDFPHAIAEAIAALRYTDEKTPFADLRAMPIHKVYLDNRHLNFERLLPHWYKVFAESDEHSGGVLEQTIHAYADADLNIKRAANNLGVHPNTIRFRISKIERITTLSPRSFGGLQELLTVITIGKRSDTARLGERRIA